MDVFRGGGKPGEVQSDTTNQGSLGGSVAGLQAALFQSFDNETVNSIAAPVGRSDGRGFFCFGTIECPESLVFCTIKTKSQSSKLNYILVSWQRRIVI